MTPSESPRAAVGLVQRLSAVATEAPERTAFVFLADGETETARLTFGELEARVRSLSLRLEAAGLKGERAILLYPSGLDYVVAFVACLRAGVISAPVPDVAAGREARLLPRLAAVARDARPAAILTVDSRREAAEKLSRELGGGIVPDVITTNDVEPAAGPPDVPPAFEPGALAFLQYTSGSTSSPKGVMISQGNLDYTCRDIDASWEYDATSLTVSWLPIFHDMGLIVGISVPIYTGSCCVLMPPESFVKKPIHWIGAIDKYKASHSAAPNFAYDLAARKITKDEIAAIDLSAWRVSLSSAEPVRKETMDTFTDAFAPAGFRREVFCPGFGLAESTVKVTASATGVMPVVRELDAEAFEAGRVVAFDEHKAGARVAYAIGCGGPILDTELRIVDPDSCAPTPKGHIGEIWVRSPSIAGGYLDRPDETAATFDGRLASGDPRSWMRTGDLGFQDPDGELYCTGRIKDLIVLHGRNVYPQDVERIAEHAAPGVRPGCSAAFSLDLFGEERLCVVAEFDPARGDASRACEEIISKLAKQAELPVFGVLLVPSRALPKTSSGKVQRTFAKRGMLALKFPAIAAHFVRPAGAAARAAAAGSLDERPWAATEGDPRAAGFDLAAGLEVLDVHEAAAAAGGSGPFFTDATRLFAEDLSSGELLLGETSAATEPDSSEGEVGDPSGSATALVLELLGSLTGQDTSRLDASCAFSRFGLDSVFAVELAADLEERLGCPVPATLVWDYPTVGDAADALVELAPEGTFAAEPAPETPAHGDLGDVPQTEEASAGLDDELPSRAIAIVGVGCRLPGADGLDEYRDLIFEGRDAVVEIPPERWDVDAWYDPEVGTPGRMNTRRAGLIANIDLFDETLFGISTREASRMDPQQRLLLETTWEAIENSGVAPDSLAGQAVGVFVGVGSADYQRIQLSDPDSIDAYAATGNAMSVAANRISYCFDLRGPSLAVDTACSASLVATHLARQSLLDGECDAALICGVNAILSPEWTVAFSQAHMMAPDGKCKTFSEGANGYVRGEGCGVVLAMRLEDALAAGKNILAVVRGSAVAHGGHTNGLTAPSGAEQTRVIQRALGSAGVEPDSITYVEAHGTGTELGDPIELRALSAALKPGRERPILMGSAKASIGHLEAAAGVAGLIKAALCVRHGVVPPHLNYTGPNPHVDFEALGLEVVTERRSWPAGAPRRAGISSFGFGGTNAHVVVEAPLRSAGADVQGGLEHASFRLASTTPEALAGNAARLADWIAANRDRSLQTLAAASNAARAQLPERATALGKTHDEVIEALRGLASLDEPFGTAKSRSVGARPRVLLLFPGQGSQYAGMAAELAASHPAFRAELERCGAVLAPHMDRPLAEVLGSEELLARTRYAQPAILAVSWALFTLWRDAGLEPAACLGHSVGEVAAACVAGALDIDAGLVFLAKRGALLDRLPTGGGMAAVIGSGEDFDERLQAACEAAGLVVAAFNAPGIATVAGDEAAIEAGAADFKAAGLRLTPVDVSHAFHSPLMEPALAELEALAQELEQRAPRVSLFSSRTGRRVEAALDASHWATQLREPVEFQAALEAALEGDGIDAVLEVGAHPVTSAFCGRLVRGRDHAPAVLGSLRKKESDSHALLAAAGKLWTLGVALDEAALTGAKLPATLPVRPPRYAFEPRRHWITLQGETERRSTALYFRPELARSKGSLTSMSTPSDPASLAQEVARLFREQNAIIARLAGLDMAGLGAAGALPQAPVGGQELDLAHDEKDLATRVRRIVAGVAGANPERIQPSHALHRDIGFDSLMAVELDRRLRKAFPSLPEGEELFTQETSLEELVAMVDAAQENSDVDDLTEFQRRPREYGSYADLIRKDPKDTYVGGTFKAETHELHDITIEGSSITGQLDVINKYSGTASFHLTQMAAYSFVVQLIQGYICHKHGVKKDGIGMPKLNGIRMEWHTLVRVSKDVPAKLTELGHTEENGVYVYRFEFDVADGGVTGEITGFLPISAPRAEGLVEPVEYKTHAELIGMDPKDTYTGGTFQAEEQTIHHLVCDKKTLTGKLDVKNQWSGTPNFHLTQMGTYSYIVQLMLGYFCYKHGVEKDALGMPTLKEFKIDWTEMVTFDTDIPCEIVEVESSFNRGWYTIRFDFTVGSPDTGEGGRGYLIGMIPEPGTSAG